MHDARGKVAAAYRQHGGSNEPLHPERVGARAVEKVRARRGPSFAIIWKGLHQSICLLSQRLRFNSYSHFLF
jgi:hypothetical protein